MYERIKEMQKQIEDREKGILRLEKDRGNFNAGSVSDKALQLLRSASFPSWVEPRVVRPLHILV